MNENALADINAHPIKVGSFKIQPKLLLEQQYNDNILATDGNETGDFITIISPYLNVQKDLGRHEFEFTGKYDIHRYADTDSENIENFNTQLTGKFEGYHNLYFPFTLSFLQDHRARNRERSNANISVEPTAFRRFIAEGGVVYKPNRFSTEVTLRREARRYDDGTSITGAAVINKDADYNQTELETTLAYETKRQWKPFISFLIGKTDFLRNTYNGTGFNGLNRDSSNKRASAGLQFDYKGLLTGKFSAGYFWKNYDSGAIEDISATSLDAEIVWKPLQKTAFTGVLLRRSIEDNDIAQGLIQTTASLNLDYELQQDLFFKSTNSLIYEDFVPGNREDTIYENGLGLYYIINPHFQLGAGYTRRSRDSNAAGFNYDQNVFMIKLDSAL